MSQIDLAYGDHFLPLIYDPQRFDLLSKPGTPAVALSDVEEVSPFYGYYTIDVERDGKIIGMLSVNGYTKQVFLHTWHGNFIDMREG